MDELYEQLLRDLESALHRLTKQVSPPRWVRSREKKSVLRYVERTAQQAIIQKLARIITSLRAAHLLLRHGLVQEAAVIHHVLGDLIEDVLFLSYGTLKNELTGALHKSYLASFYQEDFEEPDNVDHSTPKQPAVSRSEIRAYLAAADLSGVNPSNNQELYRTIHQALSGFVNPNSAHIMDMYGGTPQHFQVRGMLGTPKMPEYECDLWSYFERGVADFIIAAGVFGDRELQERLLLQKKSFDVQSQVLK